MMDRNLQTSVDRYFAERADRPFGDVESVSGRTLQPFSLAGQRAARNLLAKARRALDESNLDQARGFVDRAVRLPFDRHEQAAPAAFEGHMVLFCLVTDTLEESEEDDSRWLDAVIDVMATADELTQSEARDVLAAVDQDYELRSRERARLQAAVAAIPDRPKLQDLDLDPTELAERVMSILVVCQRYGTALAAPPG